MNARFYQSRIDLNAGRAQTRQTSPKTRLTSPQTSRNKFNNLGATQATSKQTSGGFISRITET